MLVLSLEIRGPPSCPGFSQLHCKDHQILQAPQLLTHPDSTTCDILSDSSFVSNFTPDLHLTALIPVLLP